MLLVTWPAVRPSFSPQPKSAPWKTTWTRLACRSRGSTAWSCCACFLCAFAKGRHGHPRPWMWLGFGQPFLGRKVSESLGRGSVKLTWPAWLDHGTSQAARAIDSWHSSARRLRRSTVGFRVPTRNLRIVTCDVSKVPLVDAALPVLKKERPQAEGFDRVVSVEMMESLVVLLIYQASCTESCAS